MSHPITKAKLWQRLSARIWVIPVSAAIAAVLVAEVLTRVDRWLPQDSRAWYLFTGEAESARELLSTIASSLMTLTGVVFSITIVALQLASAQFSPRVLRTFLEDRFTRGALGVFIGSFVYAMALLPEVKDNVSGGDQFVPSLSVFFAFLLVLATVAMFVLYIDHMAQSIRAVNAIRRVAQDARLAIDKMFPEGVANEPELPVQSPRRGLAREIPNDEPGGVIASIHDEALVQLAIERDLTIEMLPCIGDFVPRGAPLFRVWGTAPFAPRDLTRHVMLADERTGHQDPGFGFRQLVDIAEKALSPSLNDPTTAVQALDQIHDLLRGLATRRFPSPERIDDTGRARVILPRLDWERYVHLALDEIRQYGRGSLHVVRRMRALLQDLLTVAPEHRRGAVIEQLVLLDQAYARGFDIPAERALAQSTDEQGA